MTTADGQLGTHPRRVGRRALLRTAAIGVPVMLASPVVTSYAARADQSVTFTDTYGALGYALTLTSLQVDLLSQTVGTGVLDGDAQRVITELLANERARLSLITQRFRRSTRPVPTPPSANFSAVIGDGPAALRVIAEVAALATDGYAAVVQAVAGDADLLSLCSGLAGVQARHAAVTAQLAGLALAEHAAPAVDRQVATPAEVTAKLRQYLAEPATAQQAVETTL